MQKCYLLVWGAFLFFGLNSCDSSTTVDKHSKLNEQVSDSTEIELSILEILEKEKMDEPNNPMRYVNLGNYFVDERNPVEALAHFKQAYQLDSNNVDLQLVYADFLVKIGQAQESVRLYSKVLSKGKNKQAFLGLGAIQSHLNNYEIALSLIDSALIMDKHFRDAYMLKAMVFRNMGKEKETVSSYQTAIEQDPNYIPPYVSLGNLFATKKNRSALDLKLSENYFNSALEIDSNNVEALYGKGMMFQNSSRNNQALKTYTKILNVNPKFSTAIYNQGYIYLNQKIDLDSAVYFYTEFIKMDSTYADGYHNLGEAYRRKGDLEIAKSHYLNALKLNPNHELAKRAVQTIYE